MIYFITNGSHLKIGVAKDPEVRLAQLQAAQPTRMSILAVLPGSYAEENRLHTKFSACRHFGEWFRFDWDLIAYVANSTYPYHGPTTIDDFRAAEKIIQTKIDFRPGYSIELSDFWSFLESQAQQSNCKVAHLKISILHLFERDFVRWPYTEVRKDIICGIKIRPSGKSDIKRRRPVKSYSHVCAL